MSKVQQRIMPYIQLMRLDRPIGILLLLWPTLSALWIAAEGLPDITVLVVFILGVILMRSAGCAINDFADREIDGSVWRTQNRPLATGELTARQAVYVFIGMALVAFILVSLLNSLTIWLSLGGVFLAATYPFMKRYTYFPQIYLGMAFGWAIPMAFAAQTNTVPVMAWLLFLANIIWTTMYDTFYAMADREDDLLAGVKSTAVLFGDDDLVIQGIMQVGYIVVMVLVGLQLEMGFIFYLGLFLASGLFVYQQILAKDRQPQRCLQAFLNNNWVGLIIFVSLVIHYSILSVGK
ncbi:4-hydroxybenzoate octaprenyltransferase [Methylophaga sulfidovorans]|uniref:4-hydroxybenzoate octaprenyltransferase n=1 Tax=Methylophaga sulfidovorans TaxID=45496 RepID=A0A1I3TV01_9GAMM|nr:4-hydroxybenzoate octaprenyltransferase [Methylophaga sulfidovorans]SFJ74460.1 4-hydroxybenzoate polyprenyltransferase [Methylophaga sulfidovorans]